MSSVREDGAPAAAAAADMTPSYRRRTAGRHWIWVVLCAAALTVQVRSNPRWTGSDSLTLTVHVPWAGGAVACGIG